jgi:hypothetical protein
MEIEAISKVEILDSGELFVVLSSGGKPMYQHVYRAGAEVYWDNDKNGFKAPPPRKWSHSEWYHHIVSIVASELGVTLELSSKTNWANVPEHTKAEICAKQNT